MINARHPAVANMIIERSVGVDGFEPPSWTSGERGPARTRIMNLAGSDKGGSMRQHPELNGDAVLMPRLASHEQALL